jgi:hypothetical protein
LLAANPSAPIATIAMTSATGRDAAMRATNSRHGAVPCSRASSGARRIAVTAGGPQQEAGQRAAAVSGRARGGLGAGCGGSSATRRARARLPGGAGALLAHLRAEQPPPNSAISAGTSVIATTMLISVVSARPGRTRGRSRACRDERARSRRRR